AISYVSPGQLNVQAPADTATGPVPVQVTSPSGTAAGTATLQNYAPAFFTFLTRYAAAVHNTDGVYVAPAGQLVGKAAPLADLTQLRVTIGGVAATVQFAGIVAAGEYQINVMVPQVPNGDQPILATIAGVSSQTGVSIPVLNPAGAAVTVTLSPAGGTIRCGATLTLTAKDANTTDSAVTWPG